MAYEVDQYTVSLLHFDNGTTDETGKVWTANGGAAVSKTQAKIGESSLYLSGSSQYLTTDNTTDFDFGSGDFTIDWWEYRTSNNRLSAVFSRDLNPYSNLLIGDNIDGTIMCYLSSTESTWDIASGKSMGAVILNVWTHYAVVRSGNTFYTFQNGVLKSTWTSSKAFSAGKGTPAIGNNVGNYFGGYIDELRISKGIARWTTDFTPPTSSNVPTNLTATAGDARVMLNWDAVTDVTGYNVKRSTTVGGPYETTATNVQTNSYLDTDVENGTTYYYVVTAITVNGESGNSNEASATPVVSAPLNLIATAGDAKVTLNWDVVTDAIAYNVKRATTAGGPYETIASGVSINSYVDTDVVNGTTYYYVVTAVSGISESSNSNEASATPQSIVIPPAADKALLRVTMIDSSEREYRLTQSEADGFVTWYDNHASTSTTSYTINDAVDGSKEHLTFDKIISFKVIPVSS